MPRFDYGTPGSSTLQGLLIEEVRTNLLLYSRDLTNAAWTKTSCTAALNQTGLDGTANSASSVTATGANATVSQTVTQAATKSVFSAYLKLVSGVGTVKLSQDGGTTYTTVTLTSSWVKYPLAAQSTLNPQIIIQIVTSGDVIAVDCTQFESGSNGIATSPILTTSSSVQRTGDVPKTSTIPWFNPLQGTFVAQIVIEAIASGKTQFVASFDDGTINNHLQLLVSSGMQPIGEIEIGGVENVSGFGLPNVVANTVYKMGMSYNGSNNLYACNAALDGAGTMGPSAIPTGMNELVLGISPTSTTNAFDGWMQKFTYWPYAVSAAQLQALTT